MDKNELSIDYQYGLGEGCEAYFATVTLHAMNLGFWEASVGFSAKLDGKGFGGQRGFFDRCKVGLVSLGLLMITGWMITTACSRMHHWMMRDKQLDFSAPQKTL
jgi:hypothetical protein